MLGLLAAMALVFFGDESPPPGAAGVAVEPPRLLNPLEAVSAADYPRQALRRREQGRATIDLKIEASGEAAECEIVKSSGSAALDHQSCALFADRGRFAPARDRTGAAIEGSIQRIVEWRIEGESAAVAHFASPQMLNGPQMITSDDYPVEAIEAEEQGTVTARITVDERARATGCVVANSSGSATLDSETCRLLVKRGKFKAAEDATGKAVAGEYHQRITWRLEEGRVPRVEWAIRTIVRFLPDGKLGSCRIEQHGPRAVEPQDCMEEATQMVSAGQVPGIRDATGEVVMETRFVPRQLGSRDLPVRDGDTLVSRYILQVTVAPDGAVTDCRLAEWVGEPVPEAQLCSIRHNRFEGAAEAGGKAAPLEGAMIFSVTVRAEART